jgi:hypothetical protein
MLIYLYRDIRLLESLALSRVPFLVLGIRMYWTHDAPESHAFRAILRLAIAVPDLEVLHLFVITRESEAIGRIF